MTTYRSAGVDIDAADRAVDRIVDLAKRTFSPAVIPNPGGFAGLYSIGGGRVLVGCTDGVGTKVKLAAAAGRHYGVGIDLVAMSVNDLVVTGARPLFFLDYVAVARLRPRVLLEIVRGVADGCRQAGCALLGGETAEMPGVYRAGEYDLAGFAVGIAERGELLRANSVRPGDVAVALGSSGLHSNGFSLVRRAFGRRRIPREALTPTRIYVKSILRVRRQIRVCAHITGSGIAANLERVIPRTVDVELDPWPIPPIFRAVQRAGRIAEDEMFRVFNMGIGMIAIVPAAKARGVVRTLKGSGERAWIAGRVVRGRGRVRVR